MQSGMEKTHVMSFRLRRAFICKRTDFVQREKVALKMWSCICKAQQWQFTGSCYMWTSLMLMSDWRSLPPPPQKKKDKWNVESNTKMQKNQFITTASLTGSQVKEWFLAGLEPKTSDVTADGQDQSMKYAIRLDLACLRASRIKDSGGSIYPSSTAQAESKGH